METPGSGHGRNVVETFLQDTHFGHPSPLSEMRGRPARRFLGEIATPRRPGESRLRLEHAGEPCVFLSLRTRDDRWDLDLI